MSNRVVDLFIYYLPRNEPTRTQADYALLDLMVASARRAGVAGELSLYTHESANIPPDLPVTRVVRIAPKNILLQDVQLIRAYAMRDFVESEWFARPTMAVEYDELFERDPAPAFDLPFDIGLTYACFTKKQQGDSGKLNGGVVYLNYRNPGAVRSYYHAYLDKFLEIKEEFDHRFTGPCRMAEWGGDEIAHIRLLPPDAFDDHRQRRRTFSVAGAHVMTLESVRFNCQQAERYDGGLQITTYPETLVRHFNGWRKPYMPQYAERNLGLRLVETDSTSWGWKVVPLKQDHASEGRYTA